MTTTPEGFIPQPNNYVPRKNVLTEADLKELAALLSQHPCKFQVSHEEMDDIKRFTGFFKTFEKKIVDGVSWVFLALIAGIFWVLYNHGYFIK